MERRVTNAVSSERESARKAQAQQRQADRNAERVLALERAMFKARSRYLILVLTLSYKPEWRPFITFEDVQRDRDRLFGNVRFNNLLRQIKVTIWKIEEGEHLGGLHIHLVVFYDGSHRADIVIAESIGKYWVSVVTSGRGDYWNSNADKEKLASSPWGDCTGQIDRGNTAKRASLRNYLVHYIAKDAQHVSRRTNPHSRTFGTSQFPDCEGE